MLNEEKETIISTDANKTVCSVYTFQDADRRYMLRLMQEHPESIKILHVYEQDGCTGIEFEVSYELYRGIRGAIRPKKKVSEEQREASRKRFSEMWRNKQVSGD